MRVEKDVAPHALELRFAVVRQRTAALVGGKGVATFLGALIGVAWPAAIAFAVVWLAVAALTRYSSAAALARFRSSWRRRSGELARCAA